MAKRRTTGARRGGFTLLEIVTTLTLSSLVVVTLASIFQLSVRGVTSIVDRTDLEILGRGALETIQARLIDSVQSASSNRFRIAAFRNIPTGWRQAGVRGAFHFFADVDGDGSRDWVWVWVDPVGAADAQGDIFPRPPFLKMTAFRLYPSRPDQWADYNHAFFTDYINNDPSNYFVIASNLTRTGTYVTSGGMVSLEQGFGIELMNGSNWLDMRLGLSIDRDLDGFSQGEPVVYLRQRVNLENHGNPVAGLPDPLYLSNDMAAVRDSAFPRAENAPRGNALLER